MTDDEIKITPEMIEAGRREWREWYDQDESSSELLVTRIYRAMRALEKTGDAGDD